MFFIQKNENNRIKCNNIKMELQSVNKSIYTYRMNINIRNLLNSRIKFLIYLLCTTRLWNLMLIKTN
jgi:hypothetical protein